VNLLREHQRIYEAIREGDAAKAATTMAKHLAQVEAALQSAKRQ
jgi:GntR family transcriptional repressor for pyruvate dehydrogenase complex